MGRTLEEMIRTIPGEGGWWKAGSEAAYLAIAKELIKRGISQEATILILSELYWAAADCFGE